MFLTSQFLPRIIWYTAKLHYIDCRGPSIFDVHTEGGWLRWTGSSPMWTSTQKIKRVHWRHPIFFSCKEVGVLL